MRCLRREARRRPWFTVAWLPRSSKASRTLLRDRFGACYCECRPGSRASGDRGSWFVCLRVGWRRSYCAFVLGQSAAVLGTVGWRLGLRLFRLGCALVLCRSRVAHTVCVIVSGLGVPRFWLSRGTLFCILGLFLFRAGAARERIPNAHGPHPRVTCIGSLGPRHGHGVLVWAGCGRILMLCYRIPNALKR